jgi:hypothetical protein
MAKAKTSLSSAAAQMGQKGGKRKVPKGFALMTEEQKREIQSQGGKASALARWGDKKAAAKKKGKK